jgi:N-acetylglutamate synthase-like GNAT family acetyltransferase
MVIEMKAEQFPSEETPVMHPTLLRRATAADQPQITALIRAARLNPLSLDWRRFLVADEGGRIVGAGQVKPHGDGAREMASIAVTPDRQGVGIGGAIVATIISLELPPLYLYCAEYNERYYVRFGFHALTPAEMPRSLRRIHTFANTLMGVINAVTGQQRRLVVMGRGLSAA